MRVGEEIIRKLRKIAIDKNTILTAMVRDSLVEVAGRDLQYKIEAIQRQCRDMGARQWRREDLHDRKGVH